MIVDIDETLPRILLARGMSRRQVGATLRASENREKNHLPLGDAYYEMALALGGDSWKLDDEHVSYNAAIAKGVRLREIPETGTGSGKMTTMVIVKGDIPTTAITAMTGGPLSRLVEHPLLPAEARIVHLDTSDGETHATIESRRRSIAIMVPATLNDMAMVRCQLWWRHRRDALEAGAVEGMSPRMTGYLLLIAAVGLLTAYMGAPATGTAVVTAVVAVLFGVYRYGRDDEGLKDRLWDMRYKRLDARRADILEGKRT